MSTTVFFNIPYQGHLNPTVPLVAELVRRGERVIYYASEAHRPRFESVGAIFRAYPRDFTVEPDLVPGGPFGSMALLLAMGETILAEVLDEVRADEPDYVIYDSMSVWGKQIAQILKRPAICSCSILAVCSQNARALPPDWTTIKTMLPKLPAALKGVWDYGQIARRIERRFGVSSPATMDFFVNPGDLTLVYTSRDFQPGPELLDDSFRFVGPSIAPRGDHAEFPLERLDGAPVIYVSLGTLFNDRPDFFRACVRAFKDAPYRVVMALGHKIAPADLGPLPGHFTAQARVPQLDVLQRAVLFITHGGMNSVSEGLWYGVPLIVVPQMGDQLFVAQHVTALKAGLLLEIGRATPERLRALAERILSDETFRRASQRLGASLRAAGGFSKAADEILAFVNRSAR